IHRHGFGPRPHRRLRGQPVKAVVDLDCVKSLGVPREHFRCRKAARIERPSPMLVMPPRGADMNSFRGSMIASSAGYCCGPSLFAQVITAFATLWPSVLPESISL